VEEVEGCWPAGAVAKLLLLAILNRVEAEGAVRGSPAPAASAARLVAANGDTVPAAAAAGSAAGTAAAAVGVDGG
jgi:hypothetical protein